MSANSKPKPVVSVCLTTYKHEAFIAKAIESVLMQESDFEVEIVIGDDASPDGTRAVAQDYAWRYPTQIRLLPAEHNMGMSRNYVRTLKACAGTYIALLEGDDYWIDPHKLRDQAAILEHDPSAVLCFAGCTEVDEHGHALGDNFVPPNYQRDLTHLLIAREYCPPTLTVLFRNHLLSDFPASFLTVLNLDYFLFTMLTLHGRALYLPRVVAHYRRHDGGVWSSLNQEQQMRKNLNTKQVMLNYFEGDTHSAIMVGTNWYYVQLLSHFWEQGRIADFWKLYADFTRFSLKHLNKELPAFTLQLLTKRLPPSVISSLGKAVV